MSRKKSVTEKLTKRLKKQNLKKNPSSNKPRYIAKADRIIQSEAIVTESENVSSNNDSMALNETKKGEWIFTFFILGFEEHKWGNAKFFMKQINLWTSELARAIQ